MSNIEILLSLILCLVALDTTAAIRKNARDARELQPNHDLPGSETKESDVWLAGFLSPAAHFTYAHIIDLTIDLLVNQSNSFSNFFQDELQYFGRPRNLLHWVLDTSCDELSANEAFRSQWEDYSPHAMLGSDCSEASIPLGKIGTARNIPQISMSSTSPVL